MISSRGSYGVRRGIHRASIDLDEVIGARLSLLLLTDKTWTRERQRTRLESYYLEREKKRKLVKGQATVGRMTLLSRRKI